MQEVIIWLTVYGLWVSLEKPLSKTALHILPATNCHMTFNLAVIFSYIQATQVETTLSLSSSSVRATTKPQNKFSLRSPLLNKSQSYKIFLFFLNYNPRIQFIWIVVSKKFLVKRKYWWLHIYSNSSQFKLNPKNINTLFIEDLAFDALEKLIAHMPKEGLEEVLCDLLLLYLNIVK